MGKITVTCSKCKFTYDGNVLQVESNKGNTYNIMEAISISPEPRKYDMVVIMQTYPVHLDTGNFIYVNYMQGSNDLIKALNTFYDENDVCDITVLLTIDERIAPFITIADCIREYEEKPNDK